MRDRESNVDAQRPAAPAIDGLANELHAGAGLSTPGIDLLVGDSYAALTNDVQSGRVIGEGVINRVRCDQLTCRKSEVHWQIRIRKGPEKIPCKFVITSKTAAAAPQLRHRL